MEALMCLFGILIVAGLEVAMCLFGIAIVAGLVTGLWLVAKFAARYIDGEYEE